MRLIRLFSSLGLIFGLNGLAITAHADDSQDANAKVVNAVDKQHKTDIANAGAKSSGNGNTSNSANENASDSGDLRDKTAARAMAAAPKMASPMGAVPSAAKKVTGKQSAMAPMLPPRE